MVARAMYVILHDHKVLGNTVKLPHKEILRETKNIGTIEKFVK